MMRSSGTLCSLSTSTALIAEPPVAVAPRSVTISRVHRVRLTLTKHRIEQQHIPLCDVLRQLLPCQH